MCINTQACWHTVTPADQRRDINMEIEKHNSCYFSVRAEITNTHLNNFNCMRKTHLKCAHTHTHYDFNISAIKRKIPLLRPSFWCPQLTSRRRVCLVVAQHHKERSVVVWKGLLRIYLSITEQTWLLSQSQRHMIVLINLPL